jgi:hypothetical protein
MPPRKKPTKEDIKSAADRAEKKKGTRKKASPLDPPVIEDIEDLEDLEELPGDIKLPRPKSKRGRPVYKYNPQYAHVAKRALEKGALISEIADLFGINNATVWKWRQTYPDFDAAFGKLGNVFDQRIERTLAERAAGYTYDAVKIFQNKGVPVVVPYKEHVPPDVGAIKHWLSVRQPEKWRVKEEIEISSNEAFLELWKQLGANKKTDGKKE